MEKEIVKSFNAHIDVIKGILSGPEYLKAVEELGYLAVQALKNGNKIMLCGNGGSAADSQHIAAELVGRFSKNRPAMAALALTVDTSALTAIGNDFGFEELYSRQVEGLGKKGDLIIGISTSGNSPNVAKAMETARSMGLKTAGLTGANRNTRVARAADVCVCVPSSDTPRIQEAHILIGHTVCEIVEKELSAL